MPTHRIHDLITLAARATKLTNSDITGPKRFNPIMRVRLAVYKVAHDWGLHSNTQIALACGRSDHTTVISGVRSANEFYSRDPDFAALVDRLKADCAAAEPFLDPVAAKVIQLPKPTPYKGYSPLMAREVAA